MPTAFPQDLGLPYEISVEDIIYPNAQDMMVFVLYLHHTLPQFVPRASIDFACKLGETQVRVSLAGSARRPGIYQAGLRPCLQQFANLSTARLYHYRQTGDCGHVETESLASRPFRLIPSRSIAPLSLPPLQCKELELSNPSKKAISYSARLEGHRDFSIESSSIRIEPKATAKLLLRCTPTNTLSQVSARNTQGQDRTWTPWFPCPLC